MMTINPNWLVDEIILEKFKGENDWNEPEYEEPLTLERVRVDLKKQFTGTGNERTISANAIVFLYAEYTTNFPLNLFPDDLLQAKVIFKEKEFKVVDCDIFHHFTSNNVFSIELRLI